MASTNEPHPLAPTPPPPPPPPPPPEPDPVLPPYTLDDPVKTPARPDVELPPPYASVIQETYTNNGFRGEAHSQCQCRQGHPQGQMEGQGPSESQPQGHVQYNRGPPFHRCQHHHHHHNQSPGRRGRFDVLNELDADLEMATSYEQYNNWCSYNGTNTHMQYPQHVTIIRDTQAGADPINTNCLIGASAFVFCFCCVFFGMAAMIKALEVRARLRTGDVPGARRAATSSRMWSGSGLMIGSMLQLAVIIYIVYT